MASELHACWKNPEVKLLLSCLIFITLIAFFSFLPSYTNIGETTASLCYYTPKEKTVQIEAEPKGGKNKAR